MTKKTAELERQKGAVEEIALDGFDHIEFYVGNALQACYYYQRGFGFDLIAYRGLETGDRKQVSYVLKQDHVTLVLTGSLTQDNPVSEHVHKHGDGVKTIAFKSRDARNAYETAIKRGAKSIAEPSEHECDNGSIVTASVKTYGDSIHTFVERKGDTAQFLPGFKEVEGRSAPGTRVGLAAVDHVVGNVDKIAPWVDFYQKVFGFYVYQYFDAEDISTKYSALVSKVMANKSGNVKLPLNEPAQGLRKSQIQEYLDYYVAGGVQHIAISTRDIIKTVGELRRRRLPDRAQSLL
jgi:4-hydroxyphenylpyruvate dioxygenase